MPKDNGERVVTGAWHISPGLGERMLHARLDDRAVFLRELLPQDLKLEIEDLTPKKATKLAKYLATVLGKGHARQMDSEGREKWQKQLRTDGEVVRVGKRPEMLLSRSVRIITRFPHDLNPTV